MSNVTLSIGGRNYTVACGPGEEAHIEQLGRTIEAKLSSLPSLAGQSEARTLLFASLLLAQHEKGKLVYKGNADEVHELRSGSSGRAEAADDGSAAAAEALETLAGRLESLAEQLEA